MIMFAAVGLMVCYTMVESAGNGDVCCSLPYCLLHCGEEGGKW